MKVQKQSVRVLKLGTVCKDKATGLTGTLTHWNMSMERHVCYLLQPKGLDDECQPVRKLFLETSRLEAKEADFESVDVPIGILGTHVEHKPSGFHGMATEFIRHGSGCFHVVIQPKGVCKKTQDAIQPRDFDLRECTGEMITKLSEQELEASRKEKPSPSGDSMRRILPPGLR